MTNNRIDALHWEGIKTLTIILHNPNLKSVQIHAKLMPLTYCHLSNILNFLEGKNLIKRIKIDGRSQSINLTDKGHDVAITCDSLIKKMAKYDLTKGD